MCKVPLRAADTASHSTPKCPANPGPCLQHHLVPACRGSLSTWLTEIALRHREHPTASSPSSTGASIHGGSAGTCVPQQVLLSKSSCKRVCQTQHSKAWSQQGFGSSTLRLHKAMPLLTSSLKSSRYVQATSRTLCWRRGNKHQH